MEGAIVLRFLFSLTLILAFATAASGARILVHEASDHQFSRLTKARLAELGHRVESADNEGLASAIETAPALCCCPRRAYPRRLTPALISYLQNRGCLLAIAHRLLGDGPLVDGQWLTAPKHPPRPPAGRPADAVRLPAGRPRFLGASTNHPSSTRASRCMTERCQVS